MYLFLEIVFLSTEVDTNDAIEISVEGTDADVDSLTYSYVWWVNNEIIEAPDQDSLDGMYFVKNDVVKVEVTPYDGEDYGASMMSNTITIGNALPNSLTVSISGDLYNDGTLFHWVRLDKPMTFTEIADGRFSTQIVLRQQIQ